MTGLLGWVALGLLGLAGVIAVVLVALPAAPRVPMSRRRMGAAPAPSFLQGTGDAVAGAVERLLRGRGGGTAGLLERAGVKLPLRDVTIVIAAAMLAAFAVGLVLRGVVVAVVLTLVVPLLARLVAALMISRRQTAFSNQLEETLQIIAGSLRAGYSLPQAIATVAAESEAPSSEEFSRVVNETRVGRAMDEALTDAAARMRNEDFFWITQAIAINREVGGNLADVLDGVGRTIRQRGQLRRQVQALSAEGKLSAIILALLPFALFFMISLANPGYISLLYTHPVGLAMSAVAVVLLVAGIFWLSKTVKIKF